ncbi:HNH endonuclease [Mesorhizobium sp. M7A.F.Ca.MR.176.00.0.0]|nr:HNH endonuclease [Mesorhizobium sp. M7A.F.Ca.MR.176.00.0.0]
MPNVICACGYSLPKGVKCPCQQRNAKTRQAANDAARGSASERGYTAEWHRESKAYLALLGRPLCACGCGRPANMVDHIKAPKGDMVLFWDRTNWQPYNRGCNSRKNIRSEGGFGR